MPAKGAACTLRDMLKVRRVAVLLALFTAAGCKGSSPTGVADAAASSTASASAAPPTAPAPGSDDSDEVRPVYPIDDQPPLPLAVRYCDAIKTIAAKRREACCPGAPYYSSTTQCVRTLSAALRAGGVTLADADLGACEAAMTKATEGCDWVTSTGANVAPECADIIRGTLGDGKTCRSSLECTEGLRCRGLGTTRAGRCGAPLPAGTMCNISADSLVSFTSQYGYEQHHPECAGYCRRQCMDAVADGAACTASLECGTKGYCARGRCTHTAPGAGDACTDRCGGGARCIQGKCAAVKGGGESCAQDVECRGRCVRDDAGSGRCGPDCPSFLKPAK
jgi:hypothetical protein